MLYLLTRSLIWICLCSLMSGSKLPELLPSPKTECAGKTLQMSCPGNHTIIIQDVQYGAKISGSCNGTECCIYDNADCFVPYTGSALFSACSGRTLCQPTTVAAEDASSCDTAYRHLTQYLTIEYYCIPAERIGSLNSVFKKTEETEIPLYLQNTDYPSPVRSDETSGTCSVETRSCGSMINVYFVHMELSCSQQMLIQDKDTNMAYSCSENTGYNITQMFTSMSNYLMMEFSNPNGSNDGYFWIGLEDTDTNASLILECPAAPQSICMDCPYLNISDGIVSTENGTSTGQKATYRCNTGYRLLGNPVRTCQENGEWSNEEPSCKIIECPDPSNPANGNVTVDAGRTYGQVANYLCLTGYRLEGNRSRVCDANGNWSGEEPTCLEIECPPLSNPANGLVNTTGGRTYGQTASYSCQNGYRLEGNSTRLCGANENWSGAEPTCEPIVCPPLNNTVNGSVDAAINSTVGDKANYTCDGGFRLEGESVRYCDNSGTWNGTEPTCSLIACDPPQTTQNGNVTTNGLLIGNIATYVCNAGYILSGDATRTCHSNYTWTGNVPTCNRRELDSNCTIDIDCSAVIPGAICNNSMCVCAEGYERKEDKCVPVIEGSRENPGGGGLSETIIIIIAVVAAVAVISFIVITIIVCRRRRNNFLTCAASQCDQQNLCPSRPSNLPGNDSPDKHTDSKRETTPHAYDNEAYTSVPIFGETWVITDQLKARAPSGYNLELVQQDEANEKLQTQNEINHIKEREDVAPDTNSIQQLDVVATEQLQSHVSDSNADEIKSQPKIKTIENENANENKLVAESQDSDVSHISKSNNTASERSSLLVEGNFKPPTDKEQSKINSKTVDLADTVVKPPENVQTNTVEAIEQDLQENSKTVKVADTVNNTVEKPPEDLQTNTMEAIEQDLQKADLTLNVDERSIHGPNSFKDLAAAMFRAASVAKGNLEAGNYQFNFNTAADSEWSKGLIKAAKEVLAAIYSLCTIANDFSENKDDINMLDAAAHELKRATNALIVAYRVEGDSESVALKDLKAACGKFNDFAKLLVETKTKDLPTPNIKSMTLKDGEMQHAKQRIEAQATVLRKEKEYNEALKLKAIVNQDQNKRSSTSTEL